NSTNILLKRYRLMAVRIALPALRARRGLSQRQLAVLAGLRPDTISALERGESSGIRFDTLARLCETLDCGPGELLELDLDDHRVPTLGAESEDGLIRERLRDPGDRVDGETFMAALLAEAQNRRPLGKRAG